MATRQRRSVDDNAKEPTQRLNVQLPRSQYERLMFHAIKARQQPGEFLAGLIEANCRHWTVSANTRGKNKSTDRAEMTGGVNEMAMAVA
jgi:hypothetical protein